MECYARPETHKILLIGVVLLFTIPADASNPAGTAPEKTFLKPTGIDRDLEKTFARADELLASGRVQESLEQFGLVAKLAEEPLRSKALLKFGFASSILENPDAQSALTLASQVSAGHPEGPEIRAFASRILESSQSPELLTAPPKESSRFFRIRRKNSSESLWDQIGEIETLGGIGRVSLVVRRYRDLLAAYPDHPVILNNLALILARGVDTKEAEELVRRAFNAPGAEKYVEYLYDTLGYVLLKQGHAADSIEHFRYSLSMRETAERNMHMAMALELIGQPDAAEPYRARASALDATGTLGVE